MKLRWILWIVWAEGCDGRAPSPSVDRKTPTDTPAPSSASSSTQPVPGVTSDTVLVTIETTRADRVGPLYGHTRDTFPHLSTRARTGRVYSRAFANSSWTLPSITSLYTGLSPLEHGVQGVEQRLDDGIDTLGERLRSAGYQSAFFGVNPVFKVDRGLARGFDHWQAEVGWPAGRLNQSVVQWLDQSRDTTRPLFLHIHYFDPHCPYIPPAAVVLEPTTAPASERQVPIHRFEELGGCYGLEKDDGTPELRVDAYLDRYDRELRAVDDQLERLLQRLQERGLLGPEDRLVITSDHGEAFWEHDDYGHSHTLWGETTHIPLVIWDGDSTAPSAEPVSLAGLYRGLSTPGAAIRPEQEEGPILQHTSATGTTWKAIIQDGTKWMTDGHTTWTTDVATDPGDRMPIRATLTDRKPPLPTVWDASVSAPRLVPTSEEQELLRALGYSF